jgi:hypothetical protein
MKAERNKVVFRLPNQTKYFVELGGGVEGIKAEDFSLHLSALVQIDRSNYGVSLRSDSYEPPFPLREGGSQYYVG